MKCTGKYYDTLRDHHVHVERVPEDGGLMAHSEAGRSWRPSEYQVKKAINEGTLRPVGSVPDSRGEGSVDPEFDLSGGL